MATHRFYVVGTHCPSCKILIEDILGQVDFVDRVTVDLKEETVEIVTSSDLVGNDLAGLLTTEIQSNGYVLTVEKIVTEKNKSNDNLWPAVLIGLALLVLFFWLQKSGLLNFGLGGQVTPVTGFMVGLIASVSSCLAVVGGLVLSLSAKISQDRISDTKTFLLFHGGRLASFALLGGGLGLVGGAIGISLTLASILGVVASLVMILLGLNLVGLFTKNKLAWSPTIFNLFRRVEHQTWAPLLVGFGTFFLPCGFTQSMQVAALSSGSFGAGSLLMFSFALGTLPMLALLSFGSASFAHSRYAPVFFKSAGVVVLGLGLFSLLAGLAGLGLIEPLFNI